MHRHEETPAESSYDVQLLQNGAVHLFQDHRVLDDACASLAALGYQVVRLDAGAWDDVAVMHDRLAAALGFPDHYGRNLAALADCLSDVAAGGYGEGAPRERVVIVLTSYDDFAARQGPAAQALLDIVADSSRLALLRGYRMLALLQVDDPSFDLPPVGAQPLTWNPAEWLHAHRGL